MNFDFEQIVQNLQKGSYIYLGAGSGRRVFDLGNGYVVKVAKNRKGIAQNKAEHSISQRKDSPVFAKIPKVSENYDLLIMEKADSLLLFSDVLRYFKVNSYRELFQLKEFRYMTKELGLLEADLRRTRNWGKISGRPVIIDYGFTIRVRNNYYFPF